jgi:DNA-binding Xre family transcriptional regulator
MLTYNLNPIFKIRGIERPHAFLVKAGIPAYAASQMLNKSLPSLKLSHVELLCKALFCEPSDLLLFTPTKGEVYPENHPLLNLKKPEKEENLQDIIATMPFKQIKEVTKQFVEIKNANS